MSDINAHTDGSSWREILRDYLARANDIVHRGPASGPAVADATYLHPVTGMLTAANFVGMPAARPLAKPASIPRLAMEPKAQAARQAAMGYDPTPFYRGEASGRLPTSYETAFFSRDPDTAAGFAQRGGHGAPREFRLDLSKAFLDYAPVNARAYGNIVNAVAQDNPKMASQMVDAIAPGKSLEWFNEFAKRHPETTVSESGGHVRQMLDFGTKNSAEDIFRRAGYNAVDYGRDVRNLDGHGIRLSTATFDPSQAASRNITAGMGAIGAGVGAALSHDEPWLRYPAPDQDTP
jgi:hypothetical protein